MKNFNHMVIYCIVASAIATISHYSYAKSASFPVVKIQSPPREILLGPVPEIYSAERMNRDKSSNLFGFKQNKHLTHKLVFDNFYQHYAFVATKRKRPFLPYWEWMSVGMLGGPSYVTYIAIDGKEVAPVFDGVHKNLNLKLTSVQGETYVLIRARDKAVLAGSRGSTPIYNSMQILGYSKESNAIFLVTNDDKGGYVDVYKNLEHIAKFDQIDRARIGKGGIDEVSEKVALPSDISEKLFDPEIWKSKIHLVELDKKSGHYILGRNPNLPLFMVKDKDPIHRVYQYDNFTAYITQVSAGKRKSGSSVTEKLVLYNEQTKSRELIATKIRKTSFRNTGWSFGEVGLNKAGNSLGYVLKEKAGNRFVLNGVEGQLYSSISDVIHHPEFPLVAYLARKQKSDRLTLAVNGQVVEGYSPLAGPVFLEDKQTIVFPIMKNGLLYRLEIDYLLE